MYASEIIDINAEVKAPALMLAVSPVEAEYEFQPRGRTWKQDANELQQRKKRYQWNMNDTVFILRELIGMNDSAQPWHSPDQQTLLWSKFGSTVVLKLPFPLKPTEKLPSASSVVSKVQKWVRSTATINDFNDMVLKEFKEFKGGRRTYDEKVAAAKDVVDLLVGLQLELEDERLRRLKVKEDKEEEIAQDKVVIAIDDASVINVAMVPGRGKPVKQRSKKRTGSDLPSRQKKPKKKKTVRRLGGEGKKLPEDASDSDDLDLEDHGRPPKCTSMEKMVDLMFSAMPSAEEKATTVNTAAVHAAASLLAAETAAARVVSSEKIQLEQLAMQKVASTANQKFMMQMLVMMKNN